MSPQVWSPGLALALPSSVYAHSLVYPQTHTHYTHNHRDTHIYTHSHGYEYTQMHTHAFTNVHKYTHRQTYRDTNSHTFTRCHTHLHRNCALTHSEPPCSHQAESHLQAFAHVVPTPVTSSCHHSAWLTFLPPPLP